jgi:putative flippase GtrA
MWQLIRYGVVGVVSNVFTYIVYLLMTYLGVEPKIAMTFVFIVGASIGFAGNKKWTFAYQDNSSKTALRFLVAYGIAYILNLFCMWVAVDRMGIPHYLVQAVNIVVIAALLFIAQKYWIFVVSPTEVNNMSDGNLLGRGRK